MQHTNFCCRFVSRQEYKNDTYPACCFGELYIMKPNTAYKIFEAFLKYRNQTYVWIEDVYFTGILLQKTELQLEDLGSMMIEKENVKGQNFLAAGFRKNYNLVQQKNAWNRLLPDADTPSPRKQLRSNRRHRKRRPQKSQN